ncbi:hypothetical protein F441_11129 [Phytophthora nicotianae CJ01A1]|uniref:PiggyBac transposable element-derived protein 4 C-terminal zinc-ribbon domain-containing protein n=5 Tax=Phytophthora nicotianae TaxID=4792 RepID=V9EYU5_PHYNI|nr:hypothetical protein F443_11217 [Phytophthora nicotianae P1569]ETO72718.1 hypothetical protein F444_11273 [Phytophthora nicotianae P1976]ETP13845.1 hypothetical protein F441_11129 [Phytophthora nicotianae CJ01A1]ETP41903.1 hypothetical protein F442_11122 [Phytophthora nicotianae P10297]
MAVVNAYIVHAYVWEKERKKKMSHYSFLTTLHRQLIQETDSSFTEAGTSTEPSAGVREKPIAIQGDHSLVQTTDTRLNNGVHRLRQRQCKVCSYYKPANKKRGGTSTFYCVKCSEGKRGQVTLCNKVRGHQANEGMTCAQIWHILWQNGLFAPKASHIRDRSLAKP